MLKKIMAMGMATLMCLALCSCGDSEESTQQMDTKTVIVKETVYVTEANENNEQSSNEYYYDETRVEETKNITGEQYLLDIVKPYKTPYQYKEENLISMGGKEYKHGFTCMGYGDKPYRNATYFNLDERFTKLSFTFGIVEDSTHESVEVTVYTDGEIAEHFDMNMGDLPTDHTINVSGCKQLIFSVDDGYSVAMYSGTFGFAEITVS